MSQTLMYKLCAFISINLFILFCALRSFGQAPTITSVSPDTVCQGDVITITGTNFTGSTDVQVNGSSAGNLKVISSTTITANVSYQSTSGKVVVFTPNGNVSSGTILIVNPAPQPLLTDVSPSVDIPFTNCNGDNTYPLTVKNSSLNVPANSVCDIDWGDGTIHFNQPNWSNTNVTHTYMGQGYFKIILTITPPSPNRCARTFTQNFYNGVNPLASFTTTTSTTGLCTPAKIDFIIGNWINNSAGTTYQIDFGDGSPYVVLNHPLNNTNTDEVTSHTYIKSSCPNVDYTATLKAINGCFTTTYTLNQIIIREKPKADFKYQPNPDCVDEPVCFTNETTNGYSGTSCNTNTDYVWDFGDNTTSTDENPECHKYATAGSYKVKLSASNTACGTNDTIKTIIINPISPPPAVATPVTYCNYATAVPLTATGTNLLWYTSATGGNGSSTAPTPSTNNAGTTTYYVSQTLNGQCESPRVAITVTINALPVKPAVTTPVNFCKGVTATALTATGSNLLWYTTATGSTGFTTAPTPPTANVGTISYYVSQTTNGCESERAEIQVTVSEIPVAPIVTSPVIYCQNQNASPLTAIGTGLLWYTSSNGGTGNSVAPTPVTSTPGKIFYYVSAGNLCGESPRVTIETNVLAGPSAMISYSKNVLCNSADEANNPNPPLPVTITGSKGGTFSVSPSGLTIDASTGTITPSGAKPGTYTIQYFINSSGGCSNFSTTATVTVTSTPSATISYPLMCSSNTNTNVAITGTTGGSFSSTTGLNINASTGSINPSASTPGNYVITYTIAASAPCPGFITTTKVTITKAPQAGISYGVTNLCNVENTGNSNPPVKIMLTGSQGGTFNISPSTGLNIDASGTIDASGAKAATYIITYTIAASGGCSIYTTTTAVTVSSTPSATITYPAICSSNAPVNVVFSGTQGGSYTSTQGIDVNTSTGIITPANSKPGTYTVTYTIAPSTPCPGFTTTATAVITAAPTATISYGVSNLCNVKDAAATPNKPVNVKRTGDGGGVYTVNPSTGLPIDANTGTIIPSEATAGKYIIAYTIKSTGGCADFKTYDTIVVNGAPTAAINYPGAPFCSGSNSLQQVQLNGTQGGTFTSTSGLSVDDATGAINPLLSKPGNYTITYVIAPSSPCPGFTTTTGITINESPSITFAVSSQSACSGTAAVFKPSSTVANTVYNWSVKGALPQNIKGVTSGTTSGANASINLLFTNTGTTSETITVEVNSSNAVQSACAGAPYDLTLIINPVPLKLKSDTTEFCMHVPPMALAASADAGNTIKWYDANNVLLNAAPVINTTNPAQFNFYATQTNVYGCESPASPFVAIVHPVAKIVSSSYSNPTLCGVPSGSITLNVVDLNGNAMPDLPVHVHYTKFQTNYSVADSTDASGKIIIPLTAGTYSDIYVETFGCLSQKIPDIFVLKDPTPPAQPVAGYNAPLCSEAVFNLSASSPTSSQAGIINYVWVGPAFGNMPDTSQNTIVSFPSAKTSYNGIYIVYAIQNNCISPATSFPVEIKQSPVKPIITTRSPLCIGDNLSLSATSSIIGNNTLDYIWNGPGTGFPVNSANANVSNVKIEDGGVYSITVTSPQTECSATADTLIQIGGYPVVKFSKDSFNVPTGYIMKLAPAIINASDKNILPITQYEWSPPDNVQCNDAPCSLPTITVKKNICYTVKATNIYGCSGSDTICISTFCNSTQVFIPNAFTPKGAAINSKFMIRASGIASIKSFRIFNRWGRIVFEKNNFSANDPAYAWDGYVNGKLADMGVYVYTVDVVCENGTPYTYKGNVTLLQ